MLRLGRSDSVRKTHCHLGASCPNRRRTRVLPLPGPATILQWPSVAVTASSWLRFRPAVMLGAATAAVATCTARGHAAALGAQSWPRAMAS